MSALKELYLSHNQIEKISAEHLTGLDQLSVLKLDNNHLAWITGELFEVMNKLKVLTLHNNRLVSLQISPRVTAVMELVTLQDNRWRCSSDDDCHWITHALDTFNKTAVADTNAVLDRSYLARFLQN